MEYPPHIKMTHTQIVKQKLEQVPNFRERRFRNPYLAVLALRDCGHEAMLDDKSYVMSLTELAEFAISFDSFRHAWGEITREYPSLQGKDYGDGKALAQQHCINLGYEPTIKLNI